MLMCDLAIGTAGFCSLIGCGYLKFPPQDENARFLMPVTLAGNALFGLGQLAGFSALRPAAVAPAARSW
jgi:hypothetical protein